MESWTQIDYARLVEGALLDVVRSILRRTAEEGLPGGHYFYLTFRTGAEGVELPDYLRSRYPEEMTIILQHQFWDLEVEEEWFAVALSFGGARRRLVVPFAALTSFVDPSAELGLRFGAGRGHGAAAAAPDAVQPAGQAAPRREPSFEPPADGVDEPAPTASAEIISFDRFRKKKEPPD